MAIRQLPDLGSAKLDEMIRRAKTLHRQGRVDEAEKLYGAILAVHPGHFDALVGSAVLEHQRGRAPEAMRLMTAAVAANPHAPDGHVHLGRLLLALGRREEALASFGRALAIDPAQEGALYGRGMALRALGRKAEAVTAFDQVLALRPKHVGALNARGTVLLELGRFDTALASFDQSLAVEPDSADVLTNRGVALRRLGRLQESLASFERALALDPDHLGALNGRGNALRDLARPADALDVFDRLLARHPDEPGFLSNRAGVLIDLGRHEEALASAAKATALKPDHAESQLNEGVTRLILGDFKTGWQKYEFRWDIAPQSLRRPFRQRQWLGDQPLQGQTILLHAEQGYGDTIQFARYVPLVARMGASVVLEVPPALKPLMAGLEGAAQVIARGEPLPPFDLHCPLLSLPLAFRTELDTIPADIPYLAAAVDKVETWRARLDRCAALRVGLAWAGNPALRSDARRSMPLRRLGPLLTLPGVQFVSLQLEAGTDDGAMLAANPQIVHPAADWAETAAIVALLDLVVTVDTAVAHLAGAMGRPVWIMLAYSADYRWMLGRADSPWYPTARLFRQPAPGDWDSVIARLREELLLHLAARPAGGGAHHNPHSCG